MLSNNYTFLNHEFIHGFSWREPFSAALYPRLADFEDFGEAWNASSMEIVLSARGGVLRGIDFDDLRPTTPWKVTSEESEFTSQNPGALPTKRLQTGGGQIGNDRNIENDRNINVMMRFVRDQWEIELAPHYYHSKETALSVT